MTEMLERITPEMSEEEVLGVILDEIMARAEPDMAEAIRFCAIPHWFNEEIIAWLRGEGLNPSQRSREILAALTELTFVGPYHGQGWAYHEKVRDLLLRRWRERDTGCLILIRSCLCRWRRRNGEEFKELSGRAAAYFEQELVEALTEDERGEYRREQMYHMLVVNQEEGFKLFNELFEEAMNLHQLGECNVLKELAYEQRECLSLNNQRWLEFREGQLAFASARLVEAERILEKLSTKDLLVALRGEVTAYLGLLHMYMGELEKAEEDLLQSIRCYERAIGMLERVSDENKMAVTLNNLGNVYQAKGEWERAIEYYERSLAILEKLDDEHGMAFSYNNIATFHRDQGRLEEAVHLFGKSLEVLERIGDKLHADIARGNLEGAKQELEKKKGQG